MRKCVSVCYLCVCERVNVLCVHARVPASVYKPVSWMFMRVSGDIKQTQLPMNSLQFSQGN